MWFLLLLFVFGALLFWWITVWLFSWAFAPVLKRKKSSEQDLLSKSVSSKEVVSEEEMGDVEEGDITDWDDKGPEIGSGNENRSEHEDNEENGEGGHENHLEGMEFKDYLAMLERQIRLFHSLRRFYRRKFPRDE